MGETFERCDLCGEHHEKLVGEQEGECPEAWAVYYIKKYESMYLKWCESEKKIDELEKKLAEKDRVIAEVVELVDELYEISLHIYKDLKKSLEEKEAQDE